MSPYIFSKLCTCLACSTFFFLLCYTIIVLGLNCYVTYIEYHEQSLRPLAILQGSTRKKSAGTQSKQQRMKHQ